MARHKMIEYIGGDRKYTYKNVLFDKDILKQAKRTRSKSVYRGAGSNSSHLLERGLAPDVKVRNGVLKLTVNLLGTFSHRHKLTAGVALVDLAWAHNLVLGVLNELIPMGEPSCESGKGEHNREHLGGDAKGLVDDTGVEIDVRVKLALDEVLVREGDTLELHGNINHGLTADDGENIIGKLTDKSGTRVKVLVDAVTEAHEDLLAVLNILDELRDVLDIANLIEHAKDSLVGTTVAGAIESGDSASKRGVDIGLRRGHVADSRSRAVELVLSVQDEKNFDTLDDLGVRAEVRVGRRSIHHVEEVLNVAQFLLRLDDRLADTVTIAGSGNGGCGAHNAVDVLVALCTSIVDVGTNVGGVGLGIERGHGGKAGRHHSHRVSVVAECRDEVLEAIMICGVLHDLLGEAAKLLCCRQLTVDQEECGLKEVGAISELLDGVATVLKDALLTVDERDLGGAVDSVHVGRVIGAGYSTCGALYLGKIGRVDCTILNDELVALACAVINDGQGVLSEAAIGGVGSELCVHLRKTIHLLKILIIN